MAKKKIVCECKQTYTIKDRKTKEPIQYFCPGCKKVTPIKKPKVKVVEKETTEIENIEEIKETKED